jgi:hypothetical protein
MSRNDSRLGGKNTSSGDANTPVAEVEDTTNNTTQPLSFSIPTEQVELPSQGRYYSESHPLYNAETIEIKYMTAKEEDILTSPSLLKKNLTIERLLRSVILNKNINPQDLLSGDRNAILIAARKTGYGADYNVTVNCPSCYTPNEWGTDLDEIGCMHGGVESADGYDVEDNNDGTFNITLPKCKVTVTAKLLTGKDEKEVTIAAQKRKKHKLDENNLTEQLRAMIVAVNGSSNHRDLESFINFVPAFDSKYLRNAYSKIMPNVDMKSEFECSACTWVGDLEVPLTAEFFWPK